MICRTAECEDSVKPFTYCHKLLGIEGSRENRDYCNTWKSFDEQEGCFNNTSMQMFKMAADLTMKLAELSDCRVV